MSGYGPVPKSGDVFPCLTPGGGRFVVLGPSLSTRDAGSLALVDWAGHRGDDEARSMLLTFCTLTTLRRVLVSDDPVGDIEPGMWAEDGSGAQSIEVALFPEERLIAADTGTQARAAAEGQP
jgi:hypothetical protein